MTDKHIKILAGGSPFELLCNTEKVGHFLTEIIKRIGMRSLSEPHVYDIRKEIEKMGETPHPKEPEGTSGVVCCVENAIIGISVLSTSHVAIHTWPHRGYSITDIFSCRDFDVEIAAQTVNELIKPQSINIHDVSYSMDWTHNQPILYGDSVSIDHCI